MDQKNIFGRKWRLSVRMLPLVLGAAALKLLFHYAGWEFLELSALFTSLLTGTVFLLGFLLSGVLADYKESEKIPAELAASLETMADDAETFSRGGAAPRAAELALALSGLCSSLLGWFRQERETPALLEDLRGLNLPLGALEGAVPVNFIVRLKQEQHNMRRLILRVHTIRRTSFIESGYAIAETLSALLFAALMFIKLDPFLESMLLVLPIAYLFICILALIRDLDNPFDYSGGAAAGEEVSMLELQACAGRRAAGAAALNAK